MYISEQIAHLLTDKGVLVRDMWLSSRLSLDQRTLDQLDAHEVVPEDALDLDDWAYIVSRERPRDFARRSIYVHAKFPGMPPGEVAEVTFRLQGYVDHSSLGPLGTWNL